MGRLNKFTLTLDNKKFYVIGVSGGPDSIFLLNIMSKQKFNFAVCHVNYQKREQSKLEAKYVKNFCFQKKIFFFEKKVTKSDWKKYEQKHSTKNFQSLSRYIRYDFFFDTASTLDADSIVIAHHFDDFLETYLLQKYRNITPTFWGLPKKRRIKHLNSDFIIYRPLLDIRKQDIVSYLNQKKITFFNDQSNKSLSYLRNLIRKFLIMWSTHEKKNLFLQARSKNLILREINWNKVIIKEGILFNHWKKLSNSNQQRALFFLLERCNDKDLFKKKSSFLKEAAKQLNSSTKRDFVFLINKKWFFSKKNFLIKVLKNKTYEI